VTAEATVTLGAEDLPAATAVVLADVEVDTETGLGRVARFVLVPLEDSGSPLAAWEEGQLVAALPLVFGAVALPGALDAPEIVRLEPEATATGPLPDLLPAAVAAIAHAFRDASAVVVREVPLRPERFLNKAETR
jgi:CO/xanthine dehydrogenase Mo-binding subunit